MSQAVWAAHQSVRVEADDIGEPIVETVLLWGDNPIATRHLAMGHSLSIGEEGDLMVPFDAIGSTRADVVQSGGGRVLVSPPQGSSVFVDGIPSDARTIEVTSGHAAEVRFGAFTLRTRVVGGSPAMPREVTDRMGIGELGVSTFMHASILAALALFMPRLGATEDDEISRDQYLVMQHMLDASAIREEQAIETDATGDESTPKPDAPSGGGRAIGNAGAMGTDKAPPSAHGRWSAKGDAKPEDVTLSHEQKVAMVRDFGMLGLLASAQMADPDAPTVPWGPELRGSDKESHNGSLWNADPGEAWGIGGLALSGVDVGGDGNNLGIGVNDVGGLGRSLDTHLGPGEPGGMGGCKPGLKCGRVNGQHHVGAGLRMPREIKTNGRLPAEVIQRIVRQNAGRFRACYESGVRLNPSLEGRVSVSFVIDRNGAVSVAQDGDSDLPDMNVRKCIVQSFYNLAFPSPEGGTVTVTYPLALTPSN